RKLPGEYRAGYYYSTADSKILDGVTPQEIQTKTFTQVGVYEYNPENLERGKGFNLSTDGSKGAIIPAEVVWTPKLGERKLPGEYRAGYYYSTADSKILDGVTPQEIQTKT
ncbi:hypothetical protein BUE68_12595, partial [Corynebacterium diphtheriae]